jgi:hypothetical protein
MGARILAAGTLVAAAILGGCNAGTKPVAGGASVRFEVTDVRHDRGSPVIAQNGATLDFPALFSIDVNVVGLDSPGAQRLRVMTTAYIPECNGEPVPKPYRTKLIVFPDAVTSSASSNGLVQHWPLSTRTLMDLGLCHDASQPWYPSSVAPTGILMIRAQLQDADGAWSESDLTIRVGGDHRAERKRQIRFIV